MTVEPSVLLVQEAWPFYEESLGKIVSTKQVTAEESDLLEESLDDFDLQNLLLTLTQAVRKLQDIGEQHPSWDGQLARCSCCRWSSDAEVYF